MTIGWYLHHHGGGHLRRFLAVEPHLDGPVTVLSSLPRPAGLAARVAWLELPLDVDEEPPDDPTAGGALHWAPRGVAGLRERTARIAAWAQDAAATALVVDVSVEVALLGRLLALPTVVVAQHGRRDDAPHRLAYASAARIVAPWTAATHDPEHAAGAFGIAFTGAISALDAGRPEERRGGATGEGAPGWGTHDAPTASATRAGPVSAAGRDVLLVVGGGGHDLHAADVRAAAAATGRRWHVAGALRVPPGDGVVDHGPRADLAPLLRRSDVVVATAGMGAVADVAAARRPAVLLPQERPFDEQERHAAALEDAGLVAVLRRWPAAARWPGVLDEARRRDPRRWSLLHDGRGAERLARVAHQAAGVPARPPVAVA